MTKPSAFGNFLLGLVSGIIGTIIAEYFFRFVDKLQFIGNISNQLVTNMAFKKIKRIPVLNNSDSSDPNYLINAEFFTACFKLFSNDTEQIKVGLESLYHISDMIDGDIQPIAFELIEIAYKHNSDKNMGKNFVNALYKFSSIH
jgi:hypothetical protein